MKEVEKWDTFLLMLAVHNTSLSEQLCCCQALNIVLTMMKKSDRSRPIEDFALGCTNPSLPLAQLIFVNRQV